MKKGILITFEGTDCSGKETQSKALIEKLNQSKRKAIRFSFPDYASPTGKIVGGPILGKDSICKGWFLETAAKLDPKLWSLYLAADRYYHKKTIEDYLDKGYIVILDRWVESNMGIQSAKIKEKDDREAFYKWIEKLEYELLELPKPDITFFLYMPYIYSLKLRKNRNETLDQNEKDETLQQMIEKSYLELAEFKNFIKIDCINDKEIRNSLDIQDEIYTKVNNYLKQKNFE